MAGRGTWTVSDELEQEGQGALRSINNEERSNKMFRNILIALAATGALGLGIASMPADASAASCNGYHCYHHHGNGSNGSNARVDGGNLGKHAAPAARRLPSHDGDGGAARL